MPSFACPHCQKPFNVPANASAAQGRCPHCRHAVALPATKASRWYFARAKKKYGPYTWQQLQELAGRAELGPDDMLLQEGAKQWVQAGTLPALFARAAPVAKTTAPTSKAAPRNPRRRLFPWLIATAAACVLLLFGVGFAGYLYVIREKPIDPPEIKTDPLVENKKKPDPDTPKKEPVEPKTEVKVEKKKPPENKTPKPIDREQWAASFVASLNRHRLSAGLAKISQDAELSRGCQTHAQQYAKDRAGLKEDESLLVEEIAAPADMLDRWLGRVVSRTSLLAPEVQSVGLGVEPSAKGTWICVLDAVRGRGEPTIVVPAPKQTEVPLSFTGGPEVPDAQAAAGFPISVTFPPSQKVTDAGLELRDEKGKLVEGWLWTPEKPVPTKNKHNAIAFIPKGLLHAGAVYQVKARAKVDGKPWTLDWSFTTDDDGDSGGAWAKKALAKVNAYRAHAGLKPVVLDDALTRGCMKHARYLAINQGHPLLKGLDAHKEFDSLPGYSKEGHDSGVASVIGIGGEYEPIGSVDSWMATLYHRVPILEPNLKTIGFACARGRNQGWMTVMHVSSWKSEGPRPRAVYYPAADQTDVPLSFPAGGEEPNPIPEAKDNRAGFPITAFFPKNESVQAATGTLSNSKGIDVPCWFSSPEKWANPKTDQGNTICMIPKAPLAVNSTYHVHLQGQVKGEPWEKKWKFTTGEGGLSAADATRAVLERLNSYRTLAGLGPVSLDEKLSYGCQCHAEYLGKNADVLMKKNASVHDEDETIPGFTAEGLQAARNSMVFTGAPVPIFQVDDALAAFSTRVYLLHPDLQRIGFGCYLEVGKGWRCVLDVHRGRGDTRVVRYPGPMQGDVPTTGFDSLKGARLGFPISVQFPRQSNLRNVQAVLKDADGKEVAIHLSPPAQPLDPKSPPNLVAVHALQPLQAGRTYSVTVSAIDNATEWRETWQFTTVK